MTYNVFSGTLNPTHFTSLHLAKRGNMKIAFSFKCCIAALSEFSQSLLDFFSLFDSRLILTLLYDSLNLVINAFSSLLFEGIVLKRKSRALQQLNCVARTMHVHQCAVFLKEKNVICDVFHSL